MSFPRYRKYRTSGLDWPKEIPEHWSLTPLKYVASLKGRLGWQGLRSDEYTEEGPYLVTSEHFTNNDRVDWGRCHHVSLDRYNLAPEIQLRPHDLLLMKDGAAMGKLAYIDTMPGPACLNSHLLLFRPRENQLLNRYLYYVLDCPSFKTYMAQERTGTTFFGISQESIGAFQLVLPTRPEQAAIAAFLDHETAKIDALVEEQRQLLELLKEKILSLVSAPYSAGTQEMRLGYAARLVSRPVIQREGVLYTPLGLFNRGRGLFHKEPREMSDMGDSDFFWIEEGDLIISGQFAWEGAVALAGKTETGCVVSHRYPVLRGASGVALTEYLFALLSTKHGDFLLNENSRGAAGRNRPLNVGSLLKEKIWLPDLQT